MENFMSDSKDFFSSDVLFSASNPFLKPPRQAHRMWFDYLDKTARLQLDYTRDLLDINRKRVKSLHSSKSFTDVLSSQQEFAIEAGYRGLALFESARAVATELQEALTGSTSEIVAIKPAKASPVKPASKKAKTA
jgi:hypothetical protein